MLFRRRWWFYPDESGCDFEQRANPPTQERAPLPTEIGRTAGSAGAEDALALAPAQQRFLDSVVHQSRAIASGVRFGQRRFVRLWRLATALFGRGSCHRFARL